MGRLLSDFGVQQIVFEHGCWEMVTQSSSHKTELQIVARKLLSIALRTVHGEALDHSAKSHCTQINAQIDTPGAFFLHAAMNHGQRFTVFDKACSAPSSNCCNTASL